MKYSAAYKEKMVRKMIGPPTTSAYALAAETGLNRTTLSRWLHDAGKVIDMKKKQTNRQGRPQDRSAEEKLKAIMAADALSDAELGEFLRREGLRESQLEQWRREVLGALEAPTSKKGSAEARRIRELEREIRRKDKALAETAALLVLQKKVRSIWGDEADATSPRSVK